MKKITAFLILFLSLNIIIYSAVAQAHYPAFFVVKNKIVNLFVAESARERQIGLMFVDKLSQNTGMIFKFEKPQQVAFWMKNVKFPLDMLFIRDGKVLKIQKNAPVCSTVECPLYYSDFIVDSVIELNAGFCEKNGIKKGDYIKISYRN